MPAPARLGAVLSTQVQSAYMALPTVVSHVQGGRLRALRRLGNARAVNARRADHGGTGLVGHECEIPNGVLVPAGTATAIVQRLYPEITTILAQTDTRERILGLGYTVISNSPEQFAAQIGSEVEKWGKVIKRRNQAGIIRSAHFIPEPEEHLFRVHTFVKPRRAPCRYLK